MTKETQVQDHRIDQFFSGPGARADQWRDLVEAAKAWAGGAGDRAKYEGLLNDLAVTEEFHGYPGLQADGGAEGGAAAGDAAASLALATRITQALMTRSFRQHAGDWSVNEDGDGGMPDLVPSAFGRSRGAPALFRNPDRDRRSRHQLAEPCSRMAQAAASARCVHL